jgi:hypothetical protein
MVLAFFSESKASTAIGSLLRAYQFGPIADNAFVARIETEP